jgi:chromosome partitioning protein
MTRVIATYNIKGGVGKTSAAVNLAYLAAAEGERTLVWDLDPQGASTYVFRVQPHVKGGGRRLVRGKSDVDALIRGTDHDRLDLLPADFSYRHMDLALADSKDPTGRLARVLAPLRESYDYVFLDCPPSISLVSEGVFEAADALLVPIVPATLSSRTFDQLRRVVDDSGTNTRLIGFLSMVDLRKRLHREITASMQAEYPEVLKTAIPSASDVERMGAARTTIEELAPRSRAAEAYRHLWSEVRGRLNSGIPAQ